MKRLIFALTAFLLTGSVKAQLKTMDIHTLSDFQLNRETLKVKGKVKSIICQNYVAGEKYNIDLNEEWTDYTFDKAGNLTEEIEWLALGKFHSRIKYSFNKINYVTRFTCFKSDSSILYIHEHTYPENGLVTFTEKNSKGEEKFKRTFNFDKNNNLIRTNYIEPSGKSDSVVYKIDAQNRIIESEEYTIRRKSYKNKSIYSYSPKATDETIFFSPDVIYAIITKSFNDAGILTKEFYFYPNKEKEYESEIIYEYDRYGNITSFTKISGGEKKEKSSYTCKYEYDIMGNWIKRIMYQSDGAVNSTIERRIKYYPE